MASVFHQFSDLATELRLQIWEVALQQESEKRLVILLNGNSHRFVCPMRRLVSPFLAVNRESRSAGKAFYNLILEVYRRSFSRIEYPDDTTDNHLDDDPRPWEAVGNLYLSTDWDIFVVGLLWYWNAQTPLYHSRADFNIMNKYLVQPMTTSDMKRVQRAFTASLGFDGVNDIPGGLSFWEFPFRLPFDFAKSRSEQSDEVDQRNIFPGATELFYLYASAKTAIVELSPRPPLERLDQNRKGYPLNLLTVLEIGGEGIFADPWVRKNIKRRTFSP
ncbi:hypothetical protein GGR54DRAFT_34601 [Hypoxylon sp. NC1633]|nr:hypothetical protein GGR54DRAFT_34601 [Hypoxylon sp. NC1633]